MEKAGSTPGKPGHFFEALADFFELPGSDQISEEPRDLLDDEMSLDELFQRYEKRPGVSYEMLSMAHFFGLSPQQIAHPNVQGKLIIERCNTCQMGYRCFKDRNGKRHENPGFRKERCPNLETYRELAREGGNRSPIRHGMFERLMFWRHKGVSPTKGPARR